MARRRSRSELSAEIDLAVLDVIDAEVSPDCRLPPSFTTVVPSSTR